MKLNVIGHVHTCYGEKFGVPRQPGIVADAWGELVFEPEFRAADAVRGLEGFSHVWVIFVFHENASSKVGHGSDWKPLVRPPRLGGNQKVGVFASRSPFRPNPIGMSCVKLESIDYSHPDGPVLKLSGVDLVDGSPVIDIKPYLPYADSLSEASGGFANEAPSIQRVVRWDGGSEPEKISAQLRQLIESSLAADPRPAYQQGDDDSGREYGCLIESYNVRWLVRGGDICITSCNFSSSK